MGGGVLGRELALVSQSLELGSDRRPLLSVGGSDCAEAAQNRDKTNTKTATYAHFPMLGSGRPMFRRLSFIAFLLTALMASGCGGDDEKGDSGQRASASSDVNALLRSTFANVGKMKSATVDLKVRIEPRGTNAGVGAVAARLSGPFASQGANKLPKFAFDVELTSAGQTVAGGASYDGSKGYITLQGTPYEVSNLVLKQFVAGYEQSLKSRAKSAQGGLVLGALGIDFRKWLKNPRNEGETTVGDAKTIKVTGAADVAQVIADLDKITERASNLPGAGGRVPSQLTPAQKQRATEAVKAVNVTVYTGVDDQILRRLTVTADLKDTESKVDAALLFDITFTKVGGEQTFKAPANPRSFTELLQALDAAGFADLGLGGATGGEPPKVPEGTANNVDKYAACIEDAGSDRAKARKCAELLSGCEPRPPLQPDGPAVCRAAGGCLGSPARCRRAPAPLGVAARCLAARALCRAGAAPGGGPTRSRRSRYAATVCSGVGERRQRHQPQAVPVQRFGLAVSARAVHRGRDRARLRAARTRSSCSSRRRWAWCRPRR